MGDTPNRTKSVQFDQPQGDKFWTKVKAQPFVPIGILGMVAMVGYGAWNYKNKGKMSTSVYLMHLRVRAQSVVVGAMTIGVAYSLAREYLFKPKEEESK